MQKYFKLNTELKCDGNIICVKCDRDLCHKVKDLVTSRDLNYLSAT